MDIPVTNQRVKTFAATALIQIEWTKELNEGVSIREDAFKKDIEYEIAHWLNADNVTIKNLNIKYSQLKDKEV